MKERRTALQACSPWLIAIYLLLATWLGTYTGSVLLMRQSSTIHTLLIAACLAACIIIQLLIHKLGYLFGGLLSGLEVIAVSRFTKDGRTAYVRENDHLVLRETPEELVLSSVIMAPRKEKAGHYGLFWMGGVLLVLMVSAVSLLLLFFAGLTLDTGAGSFLFSLYMAGLWVAAVYGLPCYFGQVPNDGMKAILFSASEDVRRSYEKDMQLLKAWGDEEPETVDISEEALHKELSLDDDFDPMNLFRACQLLRLYEQLLFDGKEEAASSVLASLYFHRLDLPERLSLRVMEETVCCLIRGEGEEGLLLSDRLMNKDRIDMMREENSFSARKSLLEWACHTRRSHEKVSVEKLKSNVEDSLSQAAFPYRRRGWKTYLGTIS